MIYPALKKLVENLINIMQIHAEDAAEETIAHLIKVLPKYDPERGSAFSLCNISAKHFLIHLNRRANKRRAFFEPTDIEVMPGNDPVFREPSYSMEEELLERERLKLEIEQLGALGDEVGEEASRVVDVLVKIPDCDSGSSSGGPFRGRNKLAKVVQAETGLKPPELVPIMREIRNARKETK